MPSKKKKYNARFPAGRIKKIMQTDEEVGKVAQAVPVIISRTLELFVESLLTKSAQITQTRNAKTLTPSHMKQCILSESRFDFLKDLVKNIPDASVQEDNENNAIYEANLVQMNESEVASDGGGSGVLQNDTKQQPSTIEIVNKPIIAAANFYTEQQSTSTSRTPVILYGPKVTINRQTSESSSPPVKRSNLSANNSEKNHKDEPQTTLKITTTIGSSSSTIVPVPPLIPTKNSSSSTEIRTNLPMCNETTPPPLIPISHNNNSLAQNTDDSLCIDEDYDN